MTVNLGSRAVIRLGFAWVILACFSGISARAAETGGFSSLFSSTVPVHAVYRGIALPSGAGIPGFPWRMSGSFSLNWRNVGPRTPQYETQIQDEVYLADMYFALYGPVIEHVPFWIEFNMPTGGQGTTNLYQLYFQYNRFDQWTFHVGKFLVPFGRYNELYKPDQFLTVTRPLLYASPDSLDLVVRVNSPRPPFSSGYTDIGARASYYPDSDYLWAPSEVTFFVINGLGESNNRLRTFPNPNNLGIPAPPGNGVSMDFGHQNNNLADNNNNKVPGGRIVYTLGNLRVLPWPIPEGARDLNGLTVGLSGMGGQYDLEDSLSYRMGGADLAFEYQGWNFTAEFMDSYTQFKAPFTTNLTQLGEDYETIRGYFVQGSYRILNRPRWGKRLTGVVVYNQLFRRGPDEQLLLNQTISGTTYPSVNALNPSGARIGTRVDKATVGLNYIMTANLTSKFEYSYWGMHRATDQVGNIDIYQGALSLVLSF